MHRAIHEPALKSQARPLVPDFSVPRQSQPVLQRLESSAFSCACGGGCPRCMDSEPLQMRRAFDSAKAAVSGAAVHKTAAAGVGGAGSALPCIDRIQPAFGSHDLSTVSAHLGDAPARAAEAIGASAYTLGERIAFHEQPDLFTAAHEAAHVIQQRAGVQLPGNVGAAGDCYEQHADAVAARVAAGLPAHDLLPQIPADSRATETSHSAVQRQETKHDDAKSAAATDEAVKAIDAGLAKIDQELIKDTKKVRIVILDANAFQLAWDRYCDRSNTPGASMGGDLTGFVDPTHADGVTGFVLAGASIGTAIHEAMHQRAHSSFNAGRVGRAINEGTTELFTRVVIAYGGGKIARTPYEAEKTAMLRVQGICGLPALAKWYFKGDITDVQNALGPKLMYFGREMSEEKISDAIQLL